MASTSTSVPRSEAYPRAECSPPPFLSPQIFSLSVNGSRLRATRSNSTYIPNRASLAVSCSVVSSCSSMPLALPFFFFFWRGRLGSIRLLPPTTAVGACLTSLLYFLLLLLLFQAVVVGPRLSIFVMHTLPFTLASVSSLWLSLMIYVASSGRRLVPSGMATMNCIVDAENEIRKKKKKKEKGSPAHLR